MGRGRVGLGGKTGLLAEVGFGGKGGGGALRVEAE